MAGMHGASTSLAPKTYSKLLFSPSAIHTGFPSKPTKRKNYLRPKILKTLNKPYPSTPTTLITPIDSPAEKLQQTEGLELLFDGEDEEMANETSTLQEFQVADAVVVSGEERSGLGKLSARTVLRYGFYVVGVFLFQTICAVLFLGNANPNQEDGGSDSLGRNSNLLERNTCRGKYFLDKNGKVVRNGVVFTDSGNVFYWDEPELEKKIEEIRAMARDARRAEEKEVKNPEEDTGIYMNSLNSRGRMEIEKEIGARLNNVEKSLNSKLRSHEEAKEADQPLLFKKFKFKGRGTNTRKHVKGFPGSKHSASKSKNRFGNGLTPTEHLDSFQETGEKDRKMQNDLGAANGTDRHGPQLKLQSQENRGNQRPKNPLLTPEKQEASTSLSSHVLSSRNSQSESRDAGNRIPGNIMNKKQSAGTDAWWLDLPYVLGILMGRALDRERSQGLFTLKIQELGETSYTVAFEDHGDASNFCYLLESYFEDLGDFHADVVPLSVKELNEAVKAHAKKVVVVRKGQLKLYAGKPFEEVETALRSLVEQNQR